VSNLGQPLRVPAVHFERTVPGPPERVWQHLTECSRLPGWFGDDSNIERREGGTVRLMGGHIRGVVTQWRPNRRLAYSWSVFDAGAAESPYPESYLTFELEPQAGDVRLTLAHVPVLERFERQNMMGWHTFLDMLGAALRGQTVEPRGAYMKRNAALYGVDLNNLQK
jgi:uncharacterized protein YndB with AHSA1/START domain